VNALFRWLVAVSALSLLIGSALLLWGLKAVPVSNPFTPWMSDSAQGKSEGPRGPGEREHPWAVASGGVLFIVGLALAVVAGVVRP
jgi:hypothetical protein